jgi:hypothetical protein
MCYKRFWAVLVPVIEGDLDFESAIGAIHIKSLPEVLVVAWSIQNAADLVDEFVSTLLEGPSVIRCIGLAAEQPDGSRVHCLEAKGFLSLAASDRPVIQLSDEDIARTRRELASSEFLRLQSVETTDPK